jgi:hypothetical protein
MYLARVVAVSGKKPQVYPLDGELITQPRTWLFVHYAGRGACAIGYTAALAVSAARRRLEMPRGVLRVTVEREPNEMVRR